MATTGTIKLNKVFKMLDDCAPEHTVKEWPHRWWIRYRERDFALQLGKRKQKANNRDIERGHVKKMVRHLEINADCVERTLPELGRISET